MTIYNGQSTDFQTLIFFPRIIERILVKSLVNFEVHASWNQRTVNST